MFDKSTSPGELVAALEHCRRDEAKLVARRMAAIAALLWHRTADAEDPASDDPSYALITGFTKTSAEVAAVLNIAPMTASQMVGHAEALDTRLPEVARLLADGKTDWRTVQLVITRTDLVDGDLMPQLDRSLAERISGWQCLSRQRIINAVDAAVIVADPEAAKERRVSADTARHVNVSAEPNGMAKLRGALSAPAAAIVDKRLTEMANSVCAQDPRTVAQRRADALLALSEGHALLCNCGRADCPSRVAVDPAAVGAARFVINVVASQDTITGSSEQPGYLEGYGVIDAEQVRQLAEIATLSEVSEPTGTEAEAVRYQPSAALERWVRCRDLMCCFPGCDRPAWTADIDHTIPFNHQEPTAGGLTVAGNNKCYCRHHHRLKTFHDGPDGWRDEQLPDGTVVLTSPTGRVYRITPAGAELFPELRVPACAAPKPRRRSRRREKSTRTARARNQLAALRPINVEQRRVNRARRQEIDHRAWRNNMRRTLLVLKGGKPSTSRFSTWVNDPFEEHLTADWVPPPPTPPTPNDEKPPF